MPSPEGGSGFSFPSFDPISTALNVGGKLLDYFSTQDANATNREDAMNAELRAAERQRIAAQSSIQWRVKDAEQAGVHPLYALGAPTMSSAGAVLGAPAQPASLGGAMRELGQNLTGKSTPGGHNAEAPNAYQTATMQLDLENRQLQNQLLRNRVIATAQPKTPPVGDFPVPENPKVEQRPPLMFGGKRWNTDPGTSPMKAWEDQYGDEGPVASTLPLLILDQDFQKNYPVASWPGHVMRWGYNQIKQDIMNEAGNAKRFFGTLKEKYGFDPRYK